MYVTTKSNELQSETGRGHASRPYNSAERHLVRISSNVTSSDARRPILQKTALAARFFIHTSQFEILLPFVETVSTPTIAN